MARTVATLPAGTRVTDYIRLGVVAKTFPRAQIDSALATAYLRHLDTAPLIVNLLRASTPTVPAALQSPPPQVYPDNQLQ